MREAREMRAMRRRPCVEGVPWGEGIMRELRETTPRVAEPRMPRVPGILSRHPEQANCIICAGGKHTSSLPTIGITGTAHLLIPE
jgi:hypothetical protein